MSDAQKVKELEDRLTKSKALLSMIEDIKSIKAMLWLHKSNFDELKERIDKLEQRVARLE